MTVNQNGVHMTPEQIAEYYVSGGGITVGKRYDSEEHIWREKTEVVIQGLLMLILKELRKNKRKPDALQEHRKWLLRGKPVADELKADVEKQRDRLTRIAGCEVGAIDNALCVWGLEDCHYKQFNRALWRNIKSLRDVVKIAKTIKTVDDLIKLPGVGKKTIARLKKDKPMT